MVVYCDSVILIYYLEGAPDLKARAEARLSDLAAAGDQIAISDLTRLECRVKPIRTHDRATLGKYDGLFTRPDVRFAPINTAVFDLATEIRAAHNLKLGDSLHLAAAKKSGWCDRFLTNDDRLSRFSDPDLFIEVLP
jgi:predicted nucleic acid-binding protein